MAKEQLSLNELVKELKKHGITITNQARLMSMSPKKFEETIRELFVNQPLAEHMDIATWLKSSDPRPIYLGEDGEYLNSNNEWVACKMLSRKKIFGNDYVELIDLKEQQLLSVPRGHVRKVE